MPQLRLKLEPSTPRGLGDSANFKGVIHLHALRHFGAYRFRSLVGAAISGSWQRRTSLGRRGNGVVFSAAERLSPCSPKRTNRVPWPPLAMALSPRLPHAFDASRFASFPPGSGESHRTAARIGRTGWLHGIVSICVLRRHGRSNRFFFQIALFHIITLFLMAATRLVIAKGSSTRVDTNGPVAYSGLPLVAYTRTTIGYWAACYADWSFAFSFFGARSRR